ncbi:type VI secretion system protein [Paraburkholderia phenazinium]|jgi:type VI secretion system protein|uniref:Type VI secretion system protein n=2 Tax=Burkholderiaceae TaxID=119060 RepID=A0A1N6KQV8_9BURK|nr:type VI secretion system protein [Paraburkholderia phenazinium]
MAAVSAGADGQDVKGDIDVINASRLAAGRRSPSPRRWSMPLVAALCVAGCSASLPRVKVDSLAIQVAAQANLDTPIAVDAVLVRNPQLLDTLLGLPSAKWFAQREQLRRDYPKDLSVVSYELVPGQQIADSKFAFDGQRAAGVLVFADYQTVGAHRVRLDGGPSKPLLELGDQDLQLIAR